MASYSTTTGRYTNSASHTSQETAWQNANEPREAHAVVRDLSASLGNNPSAFHNALLDLLNSSSRPVRQELIQETLKQRPNFNLNAHNKEGKTVLDLAVQHGDLKFTRYLLSQGANPELASRSAASNGIQVLLTAWRRKNLLYAHFNENNRHSWTPLDRALYEGRHEEVRARLADTLAKYGVAKVWEGAMNEGDKSILRALLVIGTPTEMRQLTQYKLLPVGQWLDALRDDPGLYAVLKEFPYQSAKRGMHKNFNGQAYFTGTIKKILCRHFPPYLLEQQAQHPQLKFDYSEFGSLDAIARNVKSSIQNTYNTLKSQASETHLVDNEKMGQFLVRQFETMKKESKQNKMMMMQSTNHAMGLTLRIKEKHGKKSYVVKFFDPNVTTTHTRCERNSVQMFETQTLGTYLTRAHLMKLYYPEPRGMSLIFVRPEEDGHASTSTTHEFSVDRALTSMDIENIDATVILHLMREGFAENLRQLHDHFSVLPDNKRIELLAAKYAKGYSALHLSMYYGHSGVVKAYVELLKQVKSIPEDQLIKLLAAKDHDGFPALYISMYNGHSEVVKAYGDAVKLLSPEKQADLLFTSSPQEESCLEAALRRGHFTAANELIQLLKQLAPNLSPKKRTELRKKVGKIYNPPPKNSTDLQAWRRFDKSLRELRAALGGLSFP